MHLPLHAELANARPNRAEGLPVARLQALLDLKQLVADDPPGLLGERSHIRPRRPEPEEWLHIHSGIYKMLYQRASCVTRP